MPRPLLRLIYHFLFAIAYYARRPRVSCLADELINLAVLVAVAPVAIVFIILFPGCFKIHSATQTQFVALVRSPVTRVLCEQRFFSTSKAT